MIRKAAADGDNDLITSHLLTVLMQTTSEQ